MTLDAVLISYPPNISYLTGSPSRDSWLLLLKNTNLYITDSRYTEEAKQKLSREFRVLETRGSLIETTAQYCRQEKIRSLGFEEKYLSFAEYKKLRAILTKNTILHPAGGRIEKLRQIKSHKELKDIKKAAQIAMMALEFIRGWLKPGRKEIEVVAQLEYFMKNSGAQASAFDIIVASGANSSFPHHISGNRKIKKNDLVLIDLGASYHGYKSDLTRVFFLGKMTGLQRKILDIVRVAQQKALKEIKPAVPISRVDAAARQYISQNGYGGFFAHALGHGVGLEVHEAPGISGKAKEKMEAGMVFTVEPAIYLPGKFGIRIEDMVLVTGKGVEVISGSLN